MNIQRRLCTSLLSNIVAHLELSNDETYGEFYKTFVSNTDYNKIAKSISYYDCTSLYRLYKALIEPLKTLEEGDKLAFSTDKPETPFSPIFNYTITIDKPRTLLSLNRWIYGNGRERTVNILNYFIVEYAKYLDMILIGMEKDQLYTLFYNFSLKVKGANSTILQALSKLTTTYQNYEPMSGPYTGFHTLINDFDNRIAIINQALSKTSSETMERRRQQRNSRKENVKTSVSLPIKTPEFMLEQNREEETNQQYSSTYRENLSSRMSAVINGESVELRKSGERDVSPNENMPTEISDNEKDDNTIKNSNESELPEEIELSSIQTKIVDSSSIKKKQISNLRREIMRRQNGRRKKRRGRKST